MSCAVIDIVAQLDTASWSGVVTWSDIVARLGGRIDA